MKITAVIPAAGLGIRLQSPVAKPLVVINDDPVIVHTVRRLSSHPLITDIILVFGSQEIDSVRELVKQKQLPKIKAVVAGGPTRKHSVKNGLAGVEDADFVLIHDGVRPFIDHKVISNVIEAAMRTGAAVAGVPAKSTLKKINAHDLEVKETLNRDEVWEIQTPQVFRRELIQEAYATDTNLEAPDDAFLVERLGHRVAVAVGSYLNIKITTPEDIMLASAIDQLLKRTNP